DRRAGQNPAAHGEGIMAETTRHIARGAVPIGVGVVVTALASLAFGASRAPDSHGQVTAATGIGTSARTTISGCMTPRSDYVTNDATLTTTSTVNVAVPG